MLHINDTTSYERPCIFPPTVVPEPCFHLAHTSNLCSCTISRVHALPGRTTRAFIPLSGVQAANPYMPMFSNVVSRRVTAYIPASTPADLENLDTGNSACLAAASVPLRGVALGRLSLTAKRVCNESCTRSIMWSYVLVRPFRPFRKSLKRSHFCNLCYHQVNSLQVDTISFLTLSKMKAY